MNPTGCPAVTVPASSAVESHCDVQRQRSLEGGCGDLCASERIVVTFVQLKNYLGSYWLATWFFLYIYPSVIVYEATGFAGPFVFCNIMQILFFTTHEFWDESYKWTPLHDLVRTYFAQILGRQNLTKSVDEVILFCLWVFSWAAVPSICFINGHIFELPTDRLERVTSYVSMMTVTFVMAYIFILLWIDMNLLEVKSNLHKPNVNKNAALNEPEFTDDLIEPDDIPDVEVVYEDISITSEFNIESVLPEFSEAVNENTIENGELSKCLKVEQGEEAKEEELDAISLSSSTLSDFDVITEEEIHLLK